MFRWRKARELAEAAYAIAVTFSIGRWAVHAAYLERGYQAIGGEYGLILITYWIAWKAIHYLFDTLEVWGRGKYRKKRRSRGMAEKQNHR